MAAGVAGWATFLARFPAGSRVSFFYTPHPQAVALDLAVQAAGLMAAPLSEKGLQGQQGLQGRENRVEVAGEVVGLPSWEEAERVGAPAPEAECLARGGVVVGETEVGSVALAAAAERLDIPEAPAGRRDILVLGGSAGDWPERLLLTWVTQTGAAVLCEPHPPSLVPTAAWARVTVFAGTAAELVRLRATVEEDEAGFRLFARKRRLPLGRLRAVVLTEGDLPGEDQVFWQERGVPLARLGGFAAERQERGI